MSVSMRDPVNQCDQQKKDAETEIVKSKVKKSGMRKGKDQVTIISAIRGYFYNQSPEQVRHPG
jgi:hypothetical protein